MVGINYDEATRGGELRECDGEWLGWATAETNHVDHCRYTWCSETSMMMMMMMTRSKYCERQRALIDKRKRQRCEDLYSAPIVGTSPLKRSSMDHTASTLQIHHTYLYLVSVHWTAPPLASASSHLIILYSFIDPVRMKGWVGLVSWSTADGLIWLTAVDTTLIVWQQR